MKSSLTVITLTTAGFLMFSVASRTRAAEAVQLRYSGLAGQTNVYRVEIESQGESGREALTGTITLSSAEAPQDLIGLCLRGQLRPKPIPGAPMVMPYYRPGGPPSLSSLLGRPDAGQRELIIRPDGRLVRQAGEASLPVPLGGLASSLIQTCPSEATNEWEEEQEVAILDEPLLLGPLTGYAGMSGAFPYMGGPGGPYPGRAPQGTLIARQKTKLQVSAVTPETVTLKKTVALDSLMLAGAEPRVSASAEGELVMDRTSGWPKRIELQCKAVSATENFSRRMVTTLRWRLLEGADRVTALAPASPQRPPDAKLSEIDVTKLVEKLESEESTTREIAARELSNAKLEKTSPQLLHVLVKLSADRDDEVRKAALTALANHGTREHVPLLLKALKQPGNASVRFAIVKALGRLQDPRAAEPLAEMLAEGATEFPQARVGIGDNQVAEALVKLGPEAETAVLTVFKERNLDTRIYACRVLKEIGTRKSLPVLKELTLHPSKELSEAAAEARRSIQAR